LASKVLALAGEPDERVEGLLVVLDAGRQRAVVDLDVAGRQDDPRDALGGEVCLGQELQALVDDLGEVARRGAQLVGDALELVGPQELARLG
jgi:hypothetical protein